VIASALGRVDARELHGAGVVYRFESD